MSNDGLPPKYGVFDPNAVPNSPEPLPVATKVVNEARKQGATSLYLGLFSVSPFLYIIFQGWIFMPAIALSIFVLWRVQMLRKEGINAITLKIAGIIMVALSIVSFFAYTPMNNEFGNAYFDQYPFMDLAWNLIMLGFFTLLAFAIMAIVYGLKSRRIASSGMSRTGIILGSIHVLFWLGLLALAVLYSISTSF